MNLQVLDKEIHLKLSRLLLITGLSALTFILIAWSLVHAPTRYGDGREYLGMTVSIANHLTPDLQAADIAESAALLQRSGDAFDNPHAGYFPDRGGRWYSYHFWFYSLLAAGPYVLLQFLGLNPFRCFQVANVLLYCLALCWLAFRFRAPRRVKAWLLLSLVLNPILLYLPWTHPEVLTFVCLFIGLLEYANERKTAAVIFTAIASLQNPGAAVIAAYIVVEEVFLARRITKRAITQGLCSLLALLPFVWTWLHYRKFSLITEIATGPMSPGKAFNLFFDLNAGIIVYVPVLALGLLWLLVKGNASAARWAVLLTLIALICSVQTNWNSGMAYINRYGSWLTPILMVATIPLVAALTRKRLLMVGALFTFTTGGMLGYCLKDYNGYNYIRLQPVAKAVISAAPAVYNPPFEVFVERAYGTEIDLSQLKEPLILANEHGIRKTVAVDDGHMAYVNAAPALAGPHNLGRLQPFKANEDVFAQDLTGGFAGNWHGLRKTPETAARWIGDDASLLFEAKPRKNVTISFKASSFYKPRHMRVVLNDTVVLETVVPLGLSAFEFKADVADFNALTIYASEPAQTPADLPELNNPDARKLSFELSGFTIK